MPFRCGNLMVVIVACFALIVPAQAPAQPREADTAKDQPASVKPRTLTSKNFVLHTDLNDADSADLLERLERMLNLISAYWARPNRQPIECYVVKDLQNWDPSALSPEGLVSIQTGGGVTATRKLSRGTEFVAKSVVYATADRGTPQHEAVHAYCGQAFGETGPLWYSEGMAEMGQYWKEGSSAVNCHPYVVEYIKTVPPKTLNDIVNASDEMTGDSWQNYAWRWALCHLLATNPNYQKRFRPLGLSLLTGGRDTFESTYGSMAKEVSFEYLFFLQHFDVGFRADLCAWDWKTKFRAPRGSSPLTAVIRSQAGWQASRCLVKEGQEYDYSADGQWTLEADGELLTADGDDNGRGRLVGVTFDDDTYSLGEPFELGAYGTFKAPASGQLLLRCREEWKDIGDENDGSVSVRIKNAGEGQPLPMPNLDKRRTR